MKIIYYDPETKEIVMMAHMVLTGESLPYIEITDEQVGWIEKSNMHTPSFFVEDGVLKKKVTPSPVPVIKPVLNYCYNIPLEIQGPVDILCQQYKSKKELHITLLNQNQMELEKVLRPVFLVGCKNNDASYPLWYFEIPANTLSSSEPIVYSYTGGDDFRLYTYKIFDNYLHEQHD